MRLSSIHVDKVGRTLWLISSNEIKFICQSNLSYRIEEYGNDCKIGADVTLMMGIRTGLCNDIVTI